MLQGVTRIHFMGIYGNPNAREPFSHFQKCELGIEDTKEKRMTAKKSKYKHVQIKKKKYFFYQITWDDITGDAGHATKEEFDKFKPSVMITHAYIYKKDKKYVWTFSSYEDGDELFSDRNIIPIGCIRKMERILV